MRRWERARLDDRCGDCNLTLEEGAPLQAIYFGKLGGKPRLIRCEQCADGPVDLEQLEVFDVAEEGRRSAEQLRQTFEFSTPDRFDAKQAQAGRDE